MQPRFFTFRIAPGQDYSILLDEILMIKFQTEVDNNTTNFMVITTRSSGPITYRFSEYKYFTDTRDTWEKYLRAVGGKV